MSSVLATARKAARPTARRPAWQEAPKPLTSVAKFVALVLVCVLVLAPFWVVLATSLSSNAQVTADNGFTLWPDHPTLGSFTGILQGGLVQHAMIVSAVLVLIATAVSLAVTTMLAYALSRPGVVGGRPVLLMCLFAFIFPPGLIPTYLVVSDLHLTGSYLSLAAPVLVSVFNLVVMRGFFQGIPVELYEAARLDGCGELRILWRIALPLSKPVVAVIGFFYAVNYWNDYFRGLFYISDSGHWPLGTLLYLLVSQGANPDANGSSAAALQQLPSNNQTMATVVLAVVPIVLVYPFIQKFFTKGVLTGAVKS
jgi:putative aldouronate transport system permease protein